MSGIIMVVLLPVQPASSASVEEDLSSEAAIQKNYVLSDVLVFVSALIITIAVDLVTASLYLLIELIETFHTSTSRRLMRAKAKKWLPMK
jgi:hypothetical protein